MYTISSTIGLLGILLRVSLAQNHSHQDCSTNISKPDIFGTKIISLLANEVERYNVTVVQTQSYFAANLTNLHFCNVTLVYTHPGQNDTITTQIWLPMAGWNGRFQGNGGGGWATGLFERLAQPVARGFAAATTDGGHVQANRNAGTWAQVSPGNVDLYLLQNFASESLEETASLGKAITENFYGVKPKYSYFNGCSTGGRQGLMLAQRYPEAYDGILAAAPAVSWDRFIPATFWGHVVMKELGSLSTNCELDGITAAATANCDKLDGVPDGVIAAPDLCKFDPFSLIGQNVTCADGSQKVITSTSAEVANATWSGPRSTTGKSLWYGLTHGANLTSYSGTTCLPGKPCASDPFTIGTDWFRFFVNKIPSFDPRSIGNLQFEELYQASVREYNSIIGTDDPDLSRFKRAGGKMLSWHGLDDQLISPRGTAHYYRSVQENDPKVRDFYRYFEAPGIQHCSGGRGAYPSESMDQLIDWVERNDAPGTLRAQSLPDKNGNVRRRDLCEYPLVSVFKGIGKNPNAASSYECRKGFQ
ncbi:hypothetical protein VTL71DRAFT_14461 [Oculimacula yallundae]|uniref:Carboxylic ester hydrolase n=1 Tax=Oculimacula yallundae TaxID=86028 RepID=A0ABR4CJV1_9HELO